MDDQTFFQPVYNIKAICRLAGMLPVTLRAWERRYGIPKPHRGEQGYRFYSEYDLKTLLWIKKQMESGLSISRAVDGLQRLRSLGKDPVMDDRSHPPEPALSLQALNENLYEALLRIDDQSAAEVMRQAFALYLVDQVLVEIVKPTLVRIGEAWHQGEIPIATEHFATQFFMQHLMSMLSAAAPPSRRGRIVAAGAPGEMHQIGLLMLVVMLRWRGWDVVYLGPDLKLDGMAEAFIPLQPWLLLFTSTLGNPQTFLGEVTKLVEKFPDPQPFVLLGGAAWKDYPLPPEIPAKILDVSPLEAVGWIERWMNENKHIHRG